jgi:hypothetical protein
MKYVFTKYIYILYTILRQLRYTETAPVSPTCNYDGLEPCTHIARTPREAASRGKARERDTCLVWRQPRGEPTPVGFLTCSKVSRCGWTAARVLRDAMVASHGLRFVLPRMLASLLSRQLTVEAASRGVLVMCVRGFRFEFPPKCRLS